MIKLVKSAFYDERATRKKLSEFILKDEQLSIGKHCAEFETKFSSWQGRDHSVMFNSGSSANLALIQSLKNLGYISENKNVGFSALTWSTNVMPLIQLNLNPIPIDVELETLNVSPEKLLQAIDTYDLGTLFITNALGFSDNIEDIKDLCERKNILLIEDNCESLGSEYNNIALGNFGEASTFSFYIGHHLSTIEGGMVCTDDAALNNMLRMVRSHGWDRHLDEDSQRNLRKQHSVDSFDAKYTFYDLGYNLRPSEINGFLGSIQMQYIDNIVSKRAKNYKILEKIYSNPDIYPLHNLMSLCSNFALPLIAKTREDREKFISKADHAQIESRPVIAGLITDHPFFKKYVVEHFKLPNTSLIHDNGFYIGNNHELTEQELKLMIDTFSK